MMPQPYEIKQLLPSDWQEYKAIRLEALQAEPGVFASSYEEQVLLSDEHWQNRLADGNCAYFGLYAREELVGLSGIVCDMNHGDEAELVASYIRKEHRGKNLSRLFYLARINWAKKEGIKRLIISHRASNLSSKFASQRFGFQFTHEVLRHWHDGAWEGNVYYDLNL